jgi:hypothetical protein
MRSKSRYCISLLTLTLVDYAGAFSKDIFPLQQTEELQDVLEKFSLNIRSSKTMPFKFFGTSQVVPRLAKEKVENCGDIGLQSRFTPRGLLLTPTFH